MRLERLAFRFVFVHSGTRIHEVEEPFRMVSVNLKDWTRVLNIKGTMEYIRLINKSARTKVTYFVSMLV